MSSLESSLERRTGVKWSFRGTIVTTSPKNPLSFINQRLPTSLWIYTSLRESCVCVKCNDALYEFAESRCSFQNTVTFRQFQEFKEICFPREYPRLTHITSKLAKYLNFKSQELGFPGIWVSNIYDVLTYTARLPCPQYTSQLAKGMPIYPRFVLSEYQVTVETSFKLYHQLWTLYHDLDEPEVVTLNPSEIVSQALSHCAGKSVTVSSDLRCVVDQSLI